MKTPRAKDPSRLPSKSLIAGILAALAGAVPLSPLFGQDSRHELSPEHSLVLPETWRMMQSFPKTFSAPEKGMGNRVSHESVKLIFTAAPVDPARKLFLSILRSPTSRLPGGQARMEEELERLLFLIVSLGYQPSDSASQQIRSTSSAPISSVEVTAQNPQGETRVFTCAAADSSTGTLRLFASRPVNDHQGAGEISSIMRSFGNAPSSSASANTGHFGHSGFGDSSRFSPEESSSSVPPEVSTLIQKHHASLVLVEGKKGVGSGFLGTLGGHTYVFTNTHVLAGNPGFKITSLKNAALQVTSPALAFGRDLARFEIAAPEQSFEIMTDLEQNLKIGDLVVVPGNADGAGVVKANVGKVIGVGPDRVEIDAPFVKGCSGSPIVHVASGKAIGIATYYTEKTVRSEADEGRSTRVVTRRFGYRLDAVPQWEPVNWQRFFAQATQLQGIEAVSADFSKLASSPSSREALSADSYTSPEIRRPMELFESAVARARNMSIADRKKLVRSLVADLRQASRGDISRFDSRTAYDYFRREVEEHSKYRDELYENLTRSLQSQMN